MDDVPYRTVHPSLRKVLHIKNYGIGIMGRMDGWLAGLVFLLSPFLFGTDRDGWVLVEAGWDGKGYGELAEAKPKPT